MQSENKAFLYARSAPTKEQVQGFETFLSEKYGKTVALEFVADETIENGFILEYGKEVFN